MQFLFVIFVSVLLGASTLPHFLQAPNRPSFSVKKNTSFSLVAIPKFLQKVATFQKNDNRSPASIAEAKVAADKVNAAEVVEEETVQDKPAELSSVSSKLNSCICKGAHVMECYLMVEGRCSEIDEMVSVSAKLAVGLEIKKDFRCKTNGQFSGRVKLRGNGAGKVKFAHLEASDEESFVMTNPCGSLDVELRWEPDNE